MDRPLFGPQTLQDVFIAVNWAIGKCRADGSLQRRLEQAYDLRAQGKYALQLFEKLTFFEELRKKRRETPRGTPYTTEYMGKTIECRNLACRVELPGDGEDQGSEGDGQCEWISDPAPRARTTAPRVCRNCGHAGHDIRRCPVARGRARSVAEPVHDESEDEAMAEAVAAPGLVSPTPAPRSAAAGGVRGCRHCKTADHNIRTCPLLSGGDSGASASSSASSSTSVPQNKRRRAPKKRAPKKQRRPAGGGGGRRRAAAALSSSSSSSSSEEDDGHREQPPAPNSFWQDVMADTEDVAEEEEVEPTHEWQTRKDDEDDDERKKSFFERAAEIGSAAVGLVRGRRGR